MFGFDHIQAMRAPSAYHRVVNDAEGKHVCVCIRTRDSKKCPCLLARLYFDVAIVDILPLVLRTLGVRRKCAAERGRVFQVFYLLEPQIKKNAFGSHTFRTRCGGHSQPVLI